jgi:hypothetical protein
MTWLDQNLPGDYAKPHKANDLISFAPVWIALHNAITALGGQHLQTRTLKNCEREYSLIFRWGLAVIVWGMHHSPFEKIPREPERCDVAELPHREERLTQLSPNYEN